ncbi:MAG: Gfo/Idh/MocA family oxidoreductase [Acidobacteriia bacterium]|nr:Gfo/Idh/MocA family oxidoreductase [Terriglobia bacterium]
MPEVLNAAIVGAGLMGGWHARYASRCCARICGVVDRNRDSAHRLAAQFSGAREFAEISALFEQCRPRVVHVCTPLDTHVEIARAALESGAHVLIEKPLAADAASTRDLMSQAQSRGLLIAPVHQFLFQRGFRRAQAAIPRMGRILHFDATFCSAGGEHAKASLDQIAAEILPHPLSLIERLAPGILQTIDWTAHRPLEGEWRIFGAGGATSIAILISMHARPTEATLRVATEGGMVELDLFHGFAAIDTASVSKGSKIARPFRKSAAEFAVAASNLTQRLAAREFAYPGLRTLIEEFYEAVLNRRAAPVGASEILAVAEARDQVMRSAAPERMRGAS